MWSNEADVDYYAIQFASHPVLGPAARFLRDYKDQINSISDGWCYWSYGTKCASDLCELLDNASRGQPYEESATIEQVKAACKKITNFVRRCKQTKDRIQPPTLVLSNLDRTIEDEAIELAEQLEHLADDQNDELGTLCLSAAIMLKRLVAKLQTTAEPLGPLSR